MRFIVLGIPGCDACAWVKTQLDAFAAKHPELDVEYIDMTTVEWETVVSGIEPPTEYPSYALVRDGRPPRTLHGRILSIELMEKWVRGF